MSSMRVNPNALLRFGSPNIPAELRITLPVGIAGAISVKNEVSFTNLHDECHMKLSVRTVGGSKGTPGKPGQSVTHCEVCNVDLDGDEHVVKGVEYAKGQYVVFTKEEAEAADPPRSPLIDLTKFVLRGDLSPLLVDKNYYLVQNAVMNGAYGLLYQALVETKAIGIGAHTLWGKEYPCAVYPNQDFPGRSVLMMAQLNCHEDLVTPDFTATIPGRPEAKQAKELVLSLMGELTPEDLESKSRNLRNEMVTARVANQDLPVTPEIAEPVATPDLMESLRTQIAAQSKPKPRAAKAKS